MLLRRVGVHLATPGRTLPRRYPLLGLVVVVAPRIVDAGRGDVTLAV